MVRRRVGGFVRATNNINLVVTGHSGNNITITVPAGLSVSEGMIIVFSNNFGINSTSNPSIYANRIYYVRNPNPSPITNTGTINVSLAPAAISSVVWPVNTGTAVTGISIPAVAGDSIGMTYYLNTSPLSADQVVPTPGVFNLAKQAQMVKSGIWPEDLTKTMTGNALVVGGGGNGGQYNGGGGGGVYNGSFSFRKSIWFTTTVGGGGGSASQISGYGFNLTANGGTSDGGSSGTVILNTNTVLASGYAGGLNPSKILSSYQNSNQYLNPNVSNPSFNNNFTDTYTYSGNASAGGGGGGSGGAGVNGAVSPVAPVTTAPAVFAGGEGGAGAGGYGGGGGAGGFAYNIVNFKRVSSYSLTNYGKSIGATNPPPSTQQTTTYAYSAFGSTIGGTGGGGGSASTATSVVNNTTAPLNNSSTTTYNLNTAIAGGANTGGGGGGGGYAGITNPGGNNGGSGQLQVTISAERYNVTYPYINSMSTTLSTTNVTLTGSGRFAV